MRGKANIAVSKLIQNKYEISATFHADPHLMKSKLSEYQSAYKPWPWQPVRQILKPKTSKMNAKETVSSRVEKKSVYNLDFASATKQPRKAVPLRPKPKMSCSKDPMDSETTYKLEYFAKVWKPPEITNPAVIKGKTVAAKEPFTVGDSIYTASYPAYDKTTIAGCHQTPIKAKDNIEILPTSKSEHSPKSTAQKDFVHHQNIERPVAIRPVENTTRPTDPIQSNTEYSDFFTDKTRDIHVVKKTPSASKVEVKQGDRKPFVDISTAMSDFTRPEGFERRMPYQPPVSNQFIIAPFDGRTTFSMAYKPWPVNKQEVPTWAKKPEYKQWSGGVTADSLYRHDFRDPKMPLPPKPIRPSETNDMIMAGKERGDCNFEMQTTYNKDFKARANIEPPRSYKIVETYKPPTEKMNCETNQQASYKGEKSEKTRPCRHTSQHKELNTNNEMTFITTYNEIYVPPRPWSSPSRASCQGTASRTRINSAPLICPRPPSSPKPPDKLIQRIPKPDHLESKIATPQSHPAADGDKST